MAEGIRRNLWTKPIIIGADPPTKSVSLMDTEKDGCICIIREAVFPEDTKPGERIGMDKCDIGGVDAWLQFTDAGVMRRFGQMLVDFAGRAEKGKG